MKGTGKENGDTFTAKNIVYLFSFISARDRSYKGKSLAGITIEVNLITLVLCYFISFCVHSVMGRDRTRKKHGRICI